MGIACGRNKTLLSPFIKKQLIDMNLFFCGDIMPGGVLPYQDSYISTELSDYMGSFDFRIGTLESAIGTNLSYDPVKMAGRQNIIYARDKDFYRVKEMGFDVVSLANNHIWDLGEEGLKNTIRLLNENGIKYCGAGMDAEEASCPAVIEKNGLRVAILAYCMFGNPWLGHVELAKEKKAGVNPLVIKKVVEDIKKAKREYDRVIVMPHWGREYTSEPWLECIRMAKQMIIAGADAVFGSHPHQIQPLVNYKGKSICFSMGNFLFPDFYMYPPRPIWYPDSVEELDNIEDVVGYPFPIEKPIRQIWNPISRYGSAVLLELNENNTVASFKYVCLSENNIVSFSNIPHEIQQQLKKSKLIIENPVIRSLVYSRRKIKNIVHGYYK